MADIKCISVQAAGNPNGSDGVAPITMFNNPQFEVNNDTHGGLGGNDHYFSVVIENNFTVYKIIKNNVRSNQSIRGGYLAIAFSIPRGYELVNSTPYLVLMDLWKTFREHCMTLKDKVAGTYEYNSTTVDKTVLDEIAKTFSLRTSNRPFRPMNNRGAKALVVAPVDKMEALLADVHYDEFSHYSEILIAETASPEANFERINNLKIPRPNSYSLWVDGQKQGVYNDADEIITVQSGADPFYYQNASKSFTIQDLLNGLQDSDISIDESNERIDVSTTNWAKPKEKVVIVRIVPAIYEEYFQANKSLIRLEGPYGELKLDRNMSFVLGEKQISILTGKQIEVSIRPNNRFELVNYEIGTDGILVNVKEKIQQRVSQGIGGAGHHRYPPQGNGTALQPTNMSPVVDVCIYLDNFLDLSDGEKTITMSLITPSGEKNIKSCTQIVSFKRFKGNVYEGHFYLPKNYAYSYIEFPTRNHKIQSELIDVTKDTQTLTNNNFKIAKEKRTKWNKSLMTIAACSLISLLMGIAIGLGIHDSLRSLFSSDKVSTEEPISDDDNIEVNDISYDDARAFLEKVGRRLMSKDVTFREIQDYKEYFNEHSATLLQYDKEYSNDKVCNQIRDYSEISQYVQNGNLDLIKNALERYNNGDFNIFPIHAELVKLIFRNTGSQNLFMNNYSKITGFDNIEENLKNNDYENVSVSTNHQNTENQSASSNRNSTTTQTSAKTTTERKHWDCEKCKKDGKPNYRYNDQGQYNRHLESHKER